MTAIDELRKLLDERGVEYYKHEDGEPLRELHEGRDDATSWRVGGANVCAVPFDDYTFDLWIDHATPEEAISATLGTIDKGAPQGADGNLDQAQVDWLRLMPDGWDGTAPATLGSGTLTAEQVRETVEKHWHDLSADYDMPEATALPEYSYDWQAIADELNATLGVS